MRDNFVQLYPLSVLKQIRDNFIEELNNANLGKNTSLSFLKCPLPTKSFINNNEVFQIMIIGGTKFESALLKYSGKKIQVLSHRQSNVPNFDTKEIFFSFLEKNLDQKVKVLTLNFGVGLKPKIRNGLLDGIRTGQTTKGHQFKGLTDNIVGEELEKFIFAKKKRTINVTCANDTICLLLAGLSKNNFDYLIGGIVGSGINFAFFLNKRTAITLESARFDKFPVSLTGKEVDNRSQQPGKHLFEKEVAGAYLYKHFNVLKHQSGGLNNKINSTLELDEIAKNENHPDHEIAQKLFERSASLAACQMAGIYFYKKISVGTGRDLSLQYIMEGSLFWHGWNYKNLVKKYLYLLDVPTNGIKFVQINQSGLIGAARLVIGTR